MTEVGTVYGQALYSLAREESLDDAILQQLQLAQACFDAEPDYLRLLGSVSLSKEDRCRLLDESLGAAVHPYLLNFLKILVEQGKIRHFSHCFTAYQQEYYRDHNILPVTAVTAIALSQPQVLRLKEKLSTITGKDTLLSNQVDPALLGGVRLDYDGKQLEDSIAQRMHNIRQLLKNTVL